MKKLSAALIMSCSCIFASAQNTGDFLNISADASTVALASASVGSNAGSYAIENNMAAASLSESRLDISAGYGKWSPNAVNSGILSAAGFIKAGNKLAIGFGFKDFMYNEYSATNDAGRVTGTFKPSELSASLGASFKFTSSLSAGLDVKFVNSSLGTEYKASTVGADVSLAYKSSGLSAGLALCNIGGKLNFGNNVSYSLPMTVKAGAAYCIAGFTASAEADYVFNAGFMAGIGAEYEIAKIVAVRAGFHYGDKTKVIPTYASLGCGVKLWGVKLNATYLLSSQAPSGSLLFGLGYAF